MVGRAANINPTPNSAQGIQAGWAINDNGQINFPGSVLNQLDLMKATGATWLRLNFRLGGAFSTWTSVILGLYDQIVNAANARGFNVLGLLSNEGWPGKQSDWCENNAEVAGGKGDNDYMQALGQVAGQLAAWFYPRISAWEIWNEPDAWTKSYGIGGSFIYPSNFAWCLKHAYGAIQAQFPDIEVITGGLFVNDLGADIGMTSATYLLQTLAFGASEIPDFEQPFDGIGEHIYIDQGRATNASNILTAVQVVGHILPVLPLWITEIGWQSGAIGAATQATNILTAWNTLQTLDQIERVFYFQVGDNPFANMTFGLYDASNNPKTALGTYQQSAIF
jgi:Glycosyl hydrolase catalytic core